MTDTFAAPASSTGLDFNELNGHLVIIDVEGYETGIVTANGDRDAIRGTLHDVDGNETHEDVLIFPKVLVGSLKPRVGQKVLGTIGQGVAKPGQNAPWIITDASGDAAAASKAVAYLEKWKSGEFTAPATPAGDDPLASLTPEQRAALAALEKAKGGAPF